MLYVWRELGTETSNVEKLKEVRLADSGLHEKDLENLISKQIAQLVRTDQLMVIMQERSRQEEPDILALDEAGTLFIFELKRSDKLHIDFDPFGPVPDAPKDPESGLFVVNTNRTYDPDAYKNMVSERKGAAYYGRKYAIQKIQAGNSVCLYHVGVGVIGIGKAKTDFRTKDIGSDPKAEYYVQIDFEYLIDISQENWSGSAVPAWEINAHFDTSYRFRQTVFQLPFKFAEFIKTKFQAKGVKSG